MECPHCRAGAPEGSTECPGCGLIFAKWHPSRPEAPAAQPRPTALPPEVVRVLALAWALCTIGGIVYFQSASRQAAGPQAASDPASLNNPAGAGIPAWLPPACDRALASLTPEEKKAHRRFAPDCKNDPVGTLLYLNQHLSRPVNRVPASEVAKLEALPSFEALSFGDDPKATVRLIVVLRNAAGDPVSADGKLDVQLEPASLGGAWEKQPTELSAAKFELTDDPLQPALRAVAGRIAFSVASARNRKLFVKVRFNDSVSDEGILDFNEVLPAR